MNDDAGQQHQRAWAQSVQAWRHYDEMESRLTRPVSERMLELAGVVAGMHVLDLACGRGEPALPAAHRVGPTGRVLGVDLVEGMLQIARERASLEGLTQVEFQVGDVEALQVGERCFDVATVRWGLMYMRAPERALLAIHRALKPGAALAIASWAEPARVPYFSLPRQLLERYRALPPLPGSDAPGTFRNADSAELEAGLRRCGFRVEKSEEMEIPVVEARDGAGIVNWIRQMGGALSKLVAEMPKHHQEAWEGDIAAAMEEHRVGESVYLGGVSRLTLARKEP